MPPTEQNPYLLDVVDPDHDMFRQSHADNPKRSSAVPAAGSSEKDNVKPDRPRSPEFLSRMSSMLPGPDAFPSIMTQQSQGRFSREVHAPLPSKALILPLLGGALDEISKFWPFLDTKSLLGMMEEQCAAGPENFHQDPCRWVTVNTLLAISIQWRTASSAINNLFPVTWPFFKNALSVFPQLSLQGKDIAACHSVLVMAIFMHGTGDMRATASLVAAAAHLARVAGLHNPDWYGSMDVNEIENHKRVFWSIQIISNNLSMRSGLPVALNDDEIEIDLPSEPTVDEAGSSSVTAAHLCRYMAQLSLLQCRILRVGRDAKKTSQSPTEFYRDISKLDHRLEEWRLGLPLELRPARVVPLSEDDLDPSIVNLQLTYFSTVWKLHQDMTNYNSRPEVSTYLLAIPELRQDFLATPWLSPTAADAARMSLLLFMKHISSPPFPLLW
ncbi:hypothetical protein LTR84_002975 [Exophiala bonariae]|uniref:Xylanolytic transcriptional activator regulatory domain-containing protein n=1 Tax=Exophiala bonariae TaxID=1690606 RepID=A0AAV9N7D1_9EURO|nr:hypothetical protein LTR84_002975 [Exophiala bonariae]